MADEIQQALRNVEAEMEQAEKKGHTLEQSLRHQSPSSRLSGTGCFLQQF